MFDETIEEDMTVNVQDLLDLYDSNNSHEMTNEALTDHLEKRMGFFSEQEKIIKETGLIETLERELRLYKLDVLDAENRLATLLTPFEKVTTGLAFQITTGLLSIAFTASFVVEVLNAYTCASDKLNCTPLDPNTANFLVPFLGAFLVGSMLSFLVSYGQQKRLAPRIQEAEQLKLDIHDNENRVIPQIKQDIQTLKRWGVIREYIQEKLEEPLNPKVLNDVDFKINSEGAKGTSELVTSEIYTIRNRYRLFDLPEEVERVVKNESLLPEEGARNNSPYIENNTSLETREDIRDDVSYKG
jgi:hypothetical protein